MSAAAFTAIILTVVGLAGPATGGSSSAVVRLKLDVKAAVGAEKGARLTVTANNGEKTASLEILPNRLRLLSGTKTLWNQPVNLAPGPHEILWKQQRNRASLCLDGRRLTTRSLSMTGRVKAVFQPSHAVGAAAPVQLQRLGEIVFADDFGRADPNMGLWHTVSGRFALNMSRNPGSSQSAFQFWGSAPEDTAVAIAATSYWFWDNYRAGVTVKTTALPACWGLIFHYRDHGNYHLLRWSQNENEPGTVRVVRRENGRETVLSEYTLTMQPDQWYRATVVTSGADLRAYISGQEIARLTDDSLVGGRIGIFVGNTKSVYFDDVTAASVNTDINADSWKLPLPFGPCEEQWSDFSNKTFFTDRNMVEWSQPRGFWTLAGGEPDKLMWFRSRIFHDARFSWNDGGTPLQWPAHPLEIVLFGDRGRQASGYRLRLAGKELTLAKDGKVVHKATLPDLSLAAIDFRADAGRLECLLNNQTVCSWLDPNPIADGEVAADLGPMDRQGTDWRNAARVSSSRRLDYSFEYAPAAWEVQSGLWCGTNRWACTPRWSFFGGRGEPGPPGVKNGNAVVWNRRRFKGDFDLELFLAPMEDTTQRVHYSHPTNLNITFAADGRNLDSGYMLLFNIYDDETRLLRRGREVLSNSDLVMKGLRRRPGPWYGRITRVWQHIRIQRRGGRILIDVAGHNDKGNYLGLRRLFEFEDPDPLDGDRIGIWTWGGNGAAIARASISYAESPGESPFRKAPPPTVEGDSAALLRVHNPSPGGIFSRELIGAPVDLEKTGTIEFDYRFIDNLSLSLFAQVRDQTGEVTLVGRSRYRTTTIPLVPVTGRPVGQANTLSHFKLDLLAAWRRVFPEGPLTLERLAVASPYETIDEIAGLGINRAGAWYEITEPVWSASPAVKMAATPRLTVRVGGVEPLDDFETDIGEWRRFGGWDGAVLYRDDHEPASGRYSLRLLNKLLAGNAGAWITRTPYNLTAFPKIRFDYRFPLDVETNLVIRANGRWFEVNTCGSGSTWQEIGRVPEFKNDNKWHHAEVDLLKLLRPQLGDGVITIEALAFADSGRKSTPQAVAYWIDNFCRVPAVDPDDGTAFTFYWETDGNISALSYVIDDNPETIPAETAREQGNLLRLTGGIDGAFLHVRAGNVQGAWSTAVHLPIAGGEVTAGAGVPVARPAEAATAPRISYVPSDRLCRTAFEAQQDPWYPEPHSDEFSARRSAWILQCLDDAATGTGCAEIINLAKNDFFSAFFRKSPWNPERWPRVAFDYKFETPGCALNLALLVNNAMAIVEWTGNHSPNHYFARENSIVGSAAKAVQDQRWHHVEFDLHDILLRKWFADTDARAEIQVRELATWATSHPPQGGAYRNPHGARLKIDNFTIFSTRGRSPAFEWKVDDGDVDGYAYTLDREPETVPQEKIMTTATRIQFNDVQPGVWHFHVRARGGGNNWGPAAHKQIEIAD